MVCSYVTTVKIKAQSVHHPQGFLSSFPVGWQPSALAPSACFVSLLIR